jgi:group I intron endonuclease
MDNSGIYSIVNIKTNKLYIGSSKTIKERWRKHKTLLNKNIHHNKHLQHSWNKYGSSCFEFNIIELCDKSDLIVREQYWIDLTKCTNKRFGYNIKKVAGSNLGTKMSKETKLKLKLSWQNEERKEKLKVLLSNRILSDESRLKMSITRKNKPNGGVSNQMITAAIIKNMKPVLFFENETLIKEFSSVKEAALFVGIAETNISKAIRKNTTIKCKYKAKYK